MKNGLLTRAVVYSGAPEKWHGLSFEQIPLFKGLEEKPYAIFWRSGHSHVAAAMPSATAAFAELVFIKTLNTEVFYHYEALCSVKNDYVKRFI